MFFEERVGLHEMLDAVIRAFGAAAQNKMRVWISLRFYLAGVPYGVMAVLCGDDAVHRYFYRTGRAVLHTYRAERAGGKDAVFLVFHRAGAYRHPRKELGKSSRVVREHGLIRYRHSQFDDFHHHFPTICGTLGDVRHFVRIGLIHRSEPSFDGARFLNVDAHDYLDLLFHFVGKFFQTLRVFNDRFGRPRRTRPNDQEEPLVAPGDDVVDLFAVLVDLRLSLL